MYAYACAAYSGALDSTHLGRRLLVIGLADMFLPACTARCMAATLAMSDNNLSVHGVVAGCPVPAAL
ncbi:hypothetical protein SAJA_07905 [Salinisphaera japonica YTM-1]|uniref:Uncharacterized protein n=1 Tax=Salinisphaera japonica YTM-1 TaxID=1209778 RepID=A0A423PS81_9GAMM|nr:hypothetical protein SAJA_07905 [Salinisphaera japonica YTM-1]